MRFLAATLVLAVTAASAAADEHHEHKSPPFWDGVLHPHAHTVAQLVEEGQAIIDRANQYYEPHQVGERTRLLVEAMARFQRAAGFAPDNADVFRQLGLVAYEAGEFGVAAKALARFRELVPEDRQLEPWRRLAVSYAKLEQWDNAVATLERSLGLELAAPDRENALALLGYMYMGQGRLEDAIDAYQRAAGLMQLGADVLALNGLAVAYDRDEQVGRAAEVLEQVRQQDPTFSHLTQQAAAGVPQVPFAPVSDRHYWLALAYEAQKHYAEAAMEWRAYLASASPTYRRRAEEHLRLVNEAQTRKAAPPVGKGAR